jgi:ubiquinone/menaquinone biosynthesis C-methylase UbiE
MVNDIVSRKYLTNVESRLSECPTGLPDNNVDVVLLYDTLHDLDDSDRVLNEIHLILKPDSLLSLNGHHLMEVEIVSEVTEKDFSSLHQKGENL